PQTLPQNGGKGHQFRQGGELVFLFGEPPHQLVPHRPLQGVPGPLPGITTAGNVPLQNHQGVLLAIGGSASHFAEQRRYGGELPPGQETAHFGFRVHTRHDLASCAGAAGISPNPDTPPCPPAAGSRTARSPNTCPTAPNPWWPAPRG